MMAKLSCVIEIKYRWAAANLISITALNAYIRQTNQLINPFHKKINDLVTTLSRGPLVS